MPINKKGITHVLLAFAVIIVFLVGVFILANLKPKTPSKTGAAATQKTLRVLSLRYFPENVSVQTAKVSSVEPAFKASLEEASKPKGYSNPNATPFLQVSIVQTINRNKHSPNVGSSIESLRNMITIDGGDLCQTIINNKIDQIWFWKDTNSEGNWGFSDEYHREWSNFLNPPQTDTICGGKRTFLVLGLDQNRGYEEALHSFGHSMEALIPDLQGSDLFSTKWAGETTNINDPTTVCGNVHYPPNGKDQGVDCTTQTPIPGATGGYDYCNQTTVSTKCENWKPDGTGTATNVNCTRWGCTEGGYLKWWLQNAPAENNGLMYQGYQLPNWIDFLADTDNAVIADATSLKYLPFRFTDYGRPAYVTNFTTSLATANPLMYDWQHDVSTTNQVLLLTASYRSSHSNDTEKIQSATYKNIALTPILRTRNGQFVTELYYLKNPPAGSAYVTVYMTSGVDNVLLTAENITGLDVNNPINQTFANSGTSSTPSITTTSGTSDIVVGVFSSWIGNIAQIQRTGKTVGMYGANPGDVYSKVGTIENTANAKLEWSSTESVQWSISAVSLRKAGSVTPSPSVTPNPSPSSSPSPTPGSTFVDLKVKSAHDTSGVWSSGPYLSIYGDYLNLQWTGNNLTSCLVPDYGVVRQASGSAIALTPVKSARTYTISCATTSGTTITDSVAVTIPTARIDLKGNLKDDLILALTSATSLKFTWTGTAVTSCIATSAVSGVSGGPTYWNGSKPISGNYTLTTTEFQYVKNAFTQSKSVFFDILCTGTTGKAYDTLLYASKPQRAF